MKKWFKILLLACMFVNVVGMAHALTHISLPAQETHIAHASDCGRHQNHHHEADYHAQDCCCVSMPVFIPARALTPSPMSVAFNYAPCSEETVLSFHFHHIERPPRA